jgi:poly(3-hydroxybutyrate) depolymerase
MSSLDANRVTACLALFALAILSVATQARGETPRSGSFSATQPAAALLGDKATEYDGLFSADEDITWRYYVPPDYRPDQPAGLLVYISPTSSGAMPKEWRSVMDRYNMIWIGADGSGNRTRVPRRILLALLAVDLARQDYVLDERRIYLSGFSGGGRVASMAAIDHAEVFSGGLFFCGADLWDLDSAPNLDTVRENRYVLITGTLDQALEPVKQTYRGYTKAGIHQTKLMIIRNMGHSTPRRSDFARALAFLNDE